MKCWANMPETAEIPALIAGTEDRVACMNHAAPDQPPSFAAAIAKRNKLLADTSLPHWSSWEYEMQACRRCPLHGPATQVVFGEGPPSAKTMFVGEQPGDQEDLAGDPSSVQPVSSSNARSQKPACTRNGLRHERGKAFQVQTSWQAAYSQEA